MIFRPKRQHISESPLLVAPRSQPQTIVHGVCAQHGPKSSCGEEFEYPSRLVVQTGHEDVRGTASAPFWLAGYHGNRCSMSRFPH